MDTTEYKLTCTVIDCLQIITVENPLKYGNHHQCHQYSILDSFIDILSSLLLAACKDSINPPCASRLGSKSCCPKANIFILSFCWNFPSKFYSSSAEGPKVHSAVKVTKQDQDSCFWLHRSMALKGLSSSSIINYFSIQQDPSKADACVAHACCTGLPIFCI